MQKDSEKGIIFLLSENKNKFPLDSPIVLAYIYIVKTSLKHVESWVFDLDFFLCILGIADSNSREDVFLVKNA
jgi:hypothetical protein